MLVTAEALRRFDNHRRAYLHWREAGLSGATVLHVDAHSDLLPQFLPEVSVREIAETPTPLLSTRLVDESYVGLNCGNYLYQAIRDGTVRRVIWIVPAYDERRAADWFREERRERLDLTLTEFKTIQHDRGVVRLRYRGAELWVCQLADLPPLDQPVVLDLDIDYFVVPRRDRLWQTPTELIAGLTARQVVLRRVDIAESVRDGYTPLGFRYLGAACEGLLTAGDAPEDALHRDLLRAEALWRDGRSAEAIARWRALAERASPRVPALLRLAVVEPDRGLWLERASAIDPTVALTPLEQTRALAIHRGYDEAAAYFAAHRPQAAEPKLDYYLAALALERNQLSEAETLLTRAVPQLSHPRERAYAHSLIASARSRAGRTDSTLACWQEACRIEPDHYRWWLQLGEAHFTAGDDERACSAYQRSLTLSPDALLHALTHHRLATIFGRRAEKARAAPHLASSRALDVDDDFRLPNLIAAGAIRRLPLLRD